jgi:AraC family transcriptional activator of pyochelin receptor
MRWLGQQCTGSEAALGQQRQGVFFLPSHIRAIVATIFDENASGAMHAMYRSAKCVELLCETLRLWVTGELVPMPSGSTIPLNEHMRLVEARALIAENYRQKLTITNISRACGLNRSKLTRGFKEVFKATVREVLTGERLSWAAKQLRGSDKSIASICFEAGYTNSASFTRAFTRRFGVPPGKYRQRDEARDMSINPSVRTGVE